MVEVFYCVECEIFSMLLLEFKRWVVKCVLIKFVVLVISICMLVYLLLEFDLLLGVEFFVLLLFVDLEFIVVGGCLLDLVGGCVVLFVMISLLFFFFCGMWIMVISVFLLFRFMMWMFCVFCLIVLIFFMVICCSLLCEVIIKILFLLLIWMILIMWLFCCVVFMLCKFLLLCFCVW